MLTPARSATSPMRSADEFIRNFTTWSQVQSQAIKSDLARTLGLTLIRGLRLARFSLIRISGGVSITCYEGKKARRSEPSSIVFLSTRSSADDRRPNPIDDSERRRHSKESKPHISIKV